MTTKIVPLIEPRAQKINYLKTPFFDFESEKSAVLERVNKVKSLIPEHEKDLFKEIEFLSTFDIVNHARDEVKGRINKLVDHDIKDRGIKLLDFQRNNLTSSSEDERKAFNEFFAELKDKVINHLEKVYKASHFITENAGFHQDQNETELNSKIRQLAILILHNISFWNANNLNSLVQFAKVEDSNINPFLLGNTDLTGSEYVDLASFNLDEFEKNLSNTGDENFNKNVLDAWKQGSSDVKTLVEFLIHRVRDIDADKLSVSFNEDNVKLALLQHSDLANDLNKHLQALHNLFNEKFDENHFNNFKKKYEERINGLVSQRETLKNELHSTEEKKLISSHGNINSVLEGGSSQDVLKNLQKLEIASWEIILILKKISELNSQSQKLIEEIRNDSASLLEPVLSQIREQHHLSKVPNSRTLWGNLFSRGRFDGQLKDIINLGSQIYHKYVSNFVNPASRLKLTCRNIENEDSLSNSLEHILNENSKELLPYYVSTAKSLRVLQVLDSTFHKYRFGSDNSTSLNDLLKHKTDNFKIVIGQDLSSAFDSLENASHIYSEKFSRHDQVLALVLDQLDNHVSEDQNLENLNLSVETLKHYIQSQPSDKSRRIPPEPKKEEVLVHHEEPVHVEEKIEEKQDENVGKKEEQIGNPEEKPIAVHEVTQEHHEQKQEEVKYEESVQEKQEEKVEHKEEVHPTPKTEDHPEVKVETKVEEVVETQPVQQEPVQVQEETKTEAETKTTESNPPVNEEKQDNLNQSNATEPSTVATEGDGDQGDDDGKGEEDKTGAKKKKKKKKK